MGNKRLLALSYAFPPIAMPESYLAAKTLGNIPGFDVDVVCARASDHGMRVDRAFEAYTAARFQRVIRVPAPWSMRLACNPLTRRFLAHRFQRPDPMALLNGAAERRLKADGLRGYDTVLSWSQFHSVHLLGLAVKRWEPRLRWLAHFSDPWVDNPFAHFDDATRTVNIALERQVIENADDLLFTSQATVDLVMAKYAPALRRKAHVVPHPFDPGLYGDAVPSGKDLIFRFVGNFYGHRTPAPFLSALERLAETSPDLLSGVRFEFVGETEKGMVGKRPGPKTTAAVRFLPPVDYLSSLQLMKTANALLVIDAPAEKSVFLPSKLVDYLGTGRPIFGITPPGATADLLDALGYPVANPSNREDIVDALRSFVTQVKNDAFQMNEARAAIISRYTVTAVGANMATLLTRPA